MSTYEAFEFPESPAAAADIGAPEAAADAPGVADDAVDTGTIAWLLPEIVNAFDASSTALRAFRAGAAGVERRDVDLAPLRIARAHLHQAHGALELGEIAGVTRLTGAIEDLLAGFEHEPERCDAIALDAIIGGCRAIVEYLEDLQGGARQQPLHLFPSYRELLAARGVERIHPADLFVVDLGIRAPRGEGAGVLDDAALGEQRGAFEQGLLRYIRNEGDATALATMSRAVAAIDGSVASGGRQGQHRSFWWATAALFEALAHGGYGHVPAQHAHLKRLAGRVNLQIRKLVEGSTAVAEKLFADTLFFVALARPVTSRVRAVQARYALVDAIPDDFETQRYGRIDPTALRAARDALAASKVAWSAIVAGDVAQIASFARDIGKLVDAVGPIRRRGLVQVAQMIDGIATDLGFDPRQPAAAVGLDVATALLFVEGALERARWLDSAFDERAELVVARLEASAVGQETPRTTVDWLDRMSREAAERQTVATFVAELQANLRNAEKVLDAFFREPTERGALGDAQKSLAQVGGALALLGHEDVHRAIERARETIAAFQVDGTPADPAAFEELAASLGAVGFYVDQIRRERIDTRAFTFDAASGHFSADMARAPVLPTPPEADEATSPAPEDALAAIASGVVDFELPLDPATVTVDDGAPGNGAERLDDRAFAATRLFDGDATLEDEIAQRAADAQGHVAELRQHPADAHARTELLSALDDVRRNAMLLDDRPLQDEAAAVVSTLRDGAHEPLGFASAADLADRVAELAIHANRAAGLAAPSAVPLDPRTPVPAEDEGAAIDAELLEIFLEEAGGVLIDAEASMRVLDADPLSATAALNLRRGFHTLKGSGRMVGLSAFGDAAWSIEDVLNDHVAGQHAASADLRAVVDYAVRYLSDWVEELRAYGSSSRIPDALIEAARALRRSAPQETPPDEARLEVDMQKPSTEPAARDAVATHEDFQRTVFAPSGTTVPDQFNFAATEVIDLDDDIQPLEFFGDQPRMREADPPTEPSTPVGDDDRGLSFTGFGIETAPADDEGFEAAADAAEADAEAEAKAKADAEADRVPELPARAVAPETAPVDDASRTAETTAPDFDLDFAVDASTAQADDVLVAFADLPAARATIVPFQPPVVARNDDVRHIGSLTLSVALFNIYLNEADELLRVLTQDFAEWRHELDRYVSDGAMRAAHSLAGSSATVGLVVAHDLAAAIEDVLQLLWREPVVLQEAQVGRLQDAVESLRRMLHRFAAERLPEPDPVRLAALLALRRELAGDDPVRTPFVPADTATAVADVASNSIELDFGDHPVREVDGAAAPLVFDASGIDESIELVAPETSASHASSDANVTRPSSDASDPPPPLDASVVPSVHDVDRTRTPLDATAMSLPLDASDGQPPLALPSHDDVGDFDAITTLAVAETPFDVDEPIELAMPDDFPLPVEDASVGAIHGTTDAAMHETIVDATHETIGDAAHGTTDGPIHGTADEPISVTTDAAIHGTTDAAIHGTTDEAIHATIIDATHGTIDEPSSGTTDAATHGTTDEAIHATIIDATHGTIDEPSSGTTDAATHGTTDDAIHDTVVDQTHDPIDQPTHGTTDEATYGATDEAIHDTVVDQTHEPIDQATHGTTVDPTYGTTVDAADRTSVDAADAATGGATDEAFPHATALPVARDEAHAGADPDAVPPVATPRPFEPAAATLPGTATVATIVAGPSFADARRSSAVETPTTLADDIDPELLDVFVAEGGEILPQIGTLLRTWQASPSDAAPARMLLRHLHTLKGSARMAGAMRLGEVAHEIETRVESAARLHDVPAALLDELLAAHDRGLELFDRLQHPADLEASSVHEVEAMADLPAASAEPDARTEDGAVGRSAMAARAREPKAATQQAVRVNSDVLDRLVNLAGEVSISRARIENEVLQIKGAMSDLNDNVERLRAQLREIELQAEFQMQSQMQSQQTAGQEREKFDPLEFDRFTRFQELTRMMAESVNDVKTLQQNLQKNLDAAETDLAAQRRMTRDLQQDLMRVRMVPFASIAERLYRVARQTAKEVDKRVNLDIRGGAVEIDRSVLERMAGPFEHLLRNHIVHGIERRDARRAAGKDETGELLVEVRQEGNEIVLTFSDDGAGLALDRIRAKGHDLGLVTGDIDDAQAAELIFHPGFSTASEVTELAGRGVGMDVVRAEALVLAGRVAVDSDPGRGTRFTINLPLTLAITQVVLVAVAGRVYALPAVLVEQVQQLRPQPLADAYRAGHLSWAGAPVRIAFLGTLLGIDDSVPVAQRSSPVLILRSAGERIAIHVDEVVGNQEVVVKNLGPQLARMTGIAGATVLGSGQIVLILNPVQLAHMTRAAAPVVAEGQAVAVDAAHVPAPAGADLKTLPTVMVVDDSLTVRRITQRLLSREGYQVVLAKDGVDALEQLQDYPPDVMLVDIEMPRMDGFDLTRNVRNDERYRHIPIVMITSRTAEKHREHAAALGVDAYLGKPYQEDELLDLLAMHVRSRRGHPA